MISKNSDWKEMKLSDAILINPRESLPKGTYAKKVGMADVPEHTKQITGYSFKEFKSGTKFRQNDTLFARITPCLENGKTSKVDILEDGELGFGSTEFIVMREKPNITDAEFVYYFARWDGVREPAIKSMTGTSGRQRVQNSLFKKISTKIPPLVEQKAIANLLSSFDDKIENNKQIIANLEEQAQVIFKSWFVDFEPFQDEEFVESELGKIPKSFSIKPLDDTFNIKYGKNLPTKKLTEEGYPVFGGNGQIGYYPEYMYEEPKLLISCRGAASGKTLVSIPFSFITNNSLIMDGVNEKYFFYFKELFNRIDFTNFATGSAQPQITISNIKNIKVIIPDHDNIKQFTSLAKPLFDYHLVLLEENERLAKIRDTLLPKLISGEIRVPME